MANQTEENGFYILTQFCKEKNKQMEIKIEYKRENNNFIISVFIDRVEVLNKIYETIENNFNDSIALETLIVIDNANARKYSDLLLRIKTNENNNILKDTIKCPKMPESISIMLTKPKSKAKENERRPYKNEERKREENRKEIGVQTANFEEKEIEQIIEKVCLRFNRNINIRFNEVKGGFECFVKLNEYSALGFSDKKYDAKCIAYTVLLRKLFPSCRSLGELMGIVRSQQFIDTFLSLTSTRPVAYVPTSQIPMQPTYSTHNYYSSFPSPYAQPPQPQTFSYNPYK